MSKSPRSGLSLEQQTYLEERLRGRQARGHAVAQSVLQRAPLSFEQLGIWLDGQLRPEPDFYNRPCLFRLRGPLDVHALRSALRAIVTRHATLRMWLEETTGPAHATTPQQVITQDTEFDLPLVDGRLAAESVGEVGEVDEVDSTIHRFVNAPFDLERGPLFRMMLVHLGESEHRLVCCFHHLVFDAASEQIFHKELAAFYEAAVSGRTADVAALPMQYLDYAQQQQHTDPQRWSSSIEYWRKEVAAAVPVSLPFDEWPTRNASSPGAGGAMGGLAPLAPRHTRNGPRPLVGPERVATMLPESLVGRLTALAGAQHTTLFSILLSAFQILLARYTGQTEITVACPLNRRTHPDWERLIGTFVDAKPFRTRIDADRPYTECLALVGQTLLHALVHDDVAMQKVRAHLPPRAAGSADISNVWFNFENFDRRNQLAGMLHMEPEDWEQNQHFGDLSLEITRVNATYNTITSFDGQRFRRAAIERLNAHYLRLLEGIVADPGKDVGDLQMLADQERQDLLGEWSGGQSPFPDDMCVQELFEAQVERTPDVTAVVFEDRRLTYRELNARANQLAHVLRGRGVGPDTLVGICMERSPEMLIGLLGILKARGAYVPLDPAYPRERLEFMVRDAAVTLVVTLQQVLDRLSGEGYSRFCLDSEQALLAAQPIDNLPVFGCASAQPKNLAYVMYTSGSTGKPKGVQIEHRAICRLVLGSSYARFGADRVFLLLSPMSFDFSTFELWGALLYGAKLVVAPHGVPDLEDLERLLKRHSVTTLLLAASLFNTIVEERPAMLAGCEQVLVGAEALSVKHIGLALARLPPAVELINAYGPTECTTFACCYSIPRDFDGDRSSIPIGRPIANTRVFILDTRRQLVPAGVSGELYIGGAGLARGYLNRPELTAERFVPDPFAPGERLYRSGDLCRFLPDGNIEYLGRLDQQVKIRGMRIEPGEIESALAHHPDVRQCAVEVRELLPSDRRLVAYVVVANSAAPPLASELRSVVQRMLPEYMVPSAFVILERLPLTPNGKIDRKALLALDAAQIASQQQTTYVAPRNITEEFLAGIWKDFLRIPRPGIHDNFFLLGGHSLLATQVVSRVRRDLKADLTLRTIFDYPTIAALAEQIKSAPNRQALQAPPLTRVGHPSVSLVSMAANSTSAVAEAPLLTESERQRLLGPWSGCRSAFPHDKCVHELFEAQVERTPDAVAVVFEDECLTYRELNARANQLAHVLRGCGVGPDMLVGICMQRSPELVIGLLGILKAGGAYLPLDPTYPRERLEFMLRDAAAQHVVIRQNVVGTLSGDGYSQFCLDGEQALLAAQPIDNLPVSGSLAYVLYTSGSTGQPKGVQIEHRAINRLVMGSSYARFGADRVFLQLAPASFDASTFELWGALLHGARLVLAPAGFPDFDDLEKLIVRHGVTTLWLTASLFNAIVEERPDMLAPVKQVLTGGEALSVRHIRLAQLRLPPTVELINGYGPTESTTFACTYSIPRNLDSHLSSIPIGRPIANTRVLILDEWRRLVPAGLPGELYIGGPGLARGYLNRLELTAERFIPDPFQPGERLYRTGDLCRFQPDGIIEFLGRRDYQVKIRGFRIELGEIEAALANHSDVRQCAVEAREFLPGDRCLVAYFVATDPVAPPSASDLRKFLQKTLPEHMLPPVFVMLDRLPLNSNGKVDRKALPSPGAIPIASQQRPEYVAPRNATEELLARIWEELLALSRPGIHDNFFLLGGHSLLATQVVSRIRRVLKVDLALRTIFIHPTIATLAEQLQSAQVCEVSAAVPMSPEMGTVRLSHDRATPGSSPLSFAQHRLWFMDQLEIDRAVYNVPFAVRFRGPLDAICLQKSVAHIIERHEVLRTTFPIVDGQPVQVVGPAFAIDLPHVDLRDLPVEQRELRTRELAEQDARQPFDLCSGPLLRAQLLRLADDENVLLLTLYHIICDGWSLEILLRELIANYDTLRNGKPVSAPSLPIQYADFSRWQREWLMGEVLQKQMAYWTKRLAGAPFLIELPADRPEANVQDRAGARERLVLSPKLSAALNALSQGEGVTLFMTLLAGFKILLQRYSGQSDVVVGTVIAGRNHRELESLIGCFVNTLVLRTDLSGDPTVRELLGRLREVTLGAYEHQDVPFEKLVEEIRPVRTFSQVPLFRVMFVLQNTPRLLATQIPNLESQVLSDLLDGHRGTAKLDLMLLMVETQDSLQGMLEYRTALFDPSTIQCLLGDLQMLLEGMTRDPLQRIGQLMPAGEGKLDHRLSPAARVTRRVSSQQATQRQQTASMQEYLAPVNPTQALLVQIWEELLGTRRISILDDFFERGGHSLLAVRMLSRVEQVFGRKVRLATLFGDATIVALARALVEPAAGRAETPLVEVQAGAGGRPFFFLHGDYLGDGLYCRQLARHLGSDQSFYTIHPFGLAGQARPDSIELMASTHIECIRAVQPQGPYFLGGYCNGAVEAFEMAQQLAACGQQVDALVLIGPPPRNLTGMQIEVRHNLPSPALPDVADSDLDDHARRASLLKMCFSAMGCYVPRPYSGRVILLQPGEELRGMPDPARGWRGVAAHLEVHVVPGDHTTALTRWLPALAERLRRCLEQGR